MEIKEEALDEPIPGPSNEGNNDPDWTPQGADAEKESTKGKIMHIDQILYYLPESSSKNGKNSTQHSTALSIFKNSS